MNKPEYQVGNYVYSITCTKEKEINRVTEVIKCRSGYIVKSGIGWYEQEPIPLTKDWLKAFEIKKLKVVGFVIDGATYWVKFGIVFYEVKGSYYMPIGEKVSKKLSGRVAIKFDKVHELQNIFAATGAQLVRK